MIGKRPARPEHGTPARKKEQRVVKKNQSAEMSRSGRGLANAAAPPAMARFSMPRGHGARASM